MTHNRIDSLLRDKGAALPFVAVILVLLLGMAAFAVDLGWLYLSGAKVQRAADSASLAGVVFLPADTGNVTSSAVMGANANGFAVGSVNGNPVGGGGPDSLTWRPLADNKLEVTLSSAVPTFFMKLFGFESFGITRTATAEYVKPVPIGSPGSSFGDGSNFLWASISGRWTAHMQGDPFQTRCDWARTLAQSGCVDSSPANQTAFFPGTTIRPGDVDSNSDPLNPEFRGDGYYYGIEIQTGRTSMTVQMYDPRFQRPNGSGCGNSSSNPTGDCDRLTFSPTPPNDSTVIGPTTRFRLFAPDGTPLDPRDNSVLLCDSSFTPTTNGNASGVDEWISLCSRNNPAAGIYVLRVSAIDGSGSNQYGVRVTTAGPGADNPNVYGINEISIYTNQSSSTANLYLAELDPIHAGKILELKFYDAGEDDGPASYTVRMPNGNTATCEWTSDSGLSGGSLPNPPRPYNQNGNCVIQTSNSSGPRFNSQWLIAKVKIPNDYTCNINTMLGCWWRMQIVNNQPHDRTTWTARVIGNPVHLVPNE